MAALTPTQALDTYIIDSFAQYLTRNVKTTYDAIVPGYTTSKLDISKTLKIMQGKPSDSSIALSPPTIGIDTIPGGPAFEPYQIGTLDGWRFMTLALYCYPAVNAVNGEPSDIASNLLKGKLRDVLGGTYSFKILDYSNPSFSWPNGVIYCNENAVIDKFVGPMDRAKSSPNALERNRFDFNVSISYPVGEQSYS